MSPQLVLVVEDELLIAMELATVLEANGFHVMGPANSVGGALDLLKQHRPDVAVLDMNLCGEMVTPVASALRDMGAPFVIASAYGVTQWPDDRVLDGVPRLNKPTTPSDLLRTLRGLLTKD